MAIVHSLRRLTTQYVAEEDRLRVVSETSREVTLVLWLTQRLLLRLLPVLLQGVARQQQADWQSELVLGFQQDAARAALEPQEPVALQPHSVAWLVDAVDVVLQGESILLRWRTTTNEEQAEVTFDPQALRQWLGIVRDQFVAAQWPLAVWPEWMGAADVPSTIGAAPVILH